MAGASFENRRRTVVPRWRNSKTTGETSELSSLGRPDQPKFDQRQFLEKLSDWKQVPNVATAAELFASALVLDKPDVAHETAEYLANCKSSIPDTLRRTAKLSLQQQHESDQYTLNPTEITRQRIRDLRMRLNEYPRDAVGWSDIAREYTSLGQLGHAIRAINLAISIAPNSRFILRTATRFFVHTDDPERAHDLLLASRSTPLDPWLVSAELAVAPIANVSPEFVREARQMVKSQKHPPRHLSEMTSALATLEMTDGNSRRARQLFRLALNDATENAIAQINWASRFIDSFDLDPSVLRVPRLFEARSWAYYNVGQWQDAFEQAWNWLFDQPFSRPPAIHGSFIASMLLEDYRSAEQLARIGLTANPRDFSLLNNLAVALSKQGKTGEAVKTLSRIQPVGLSDDVRVVLLATSGLIQFRAGDVETGRKYYGASIDAAQTIGREDLRARAIVSLALEENSAHTPEANEATNRALDLARSSSDKVVLALSKRAADLRTAASTARK